MSRSRTALVAGATGFVGGAVARRLVADGWKVVAPVRRGRSDPSRLAGVELFEVEEFSDAELRPAFATRPEVVLNLASAGVSGAVDPATAVAGNVTLVLTLLRAAARVGVRRFVHTGSCFEYAAVPAGTRMSESSRCEAWSVYGAAKHASVQLARTSADAWGVPLVVLRLFGVFGPGEASHRLLPTLISRLKNREPAELSPGTQIRDLLFIDDAASAFATAAAADTLALDGRLFNVCSGEGVSIRQVGETVARLLGAPAELLKWGSIPTRDGEPPWIVGDGSAFRLLTDWRPAFDLTSGLRATIENAGD